MWGDKMKVISSITGSSGNASLISDERTMIQIDCGINPKKVNEMCGYRLHEIVAVVVSHEHGDHTAHISDFLRLGVPCWASAETWSKLPQISHNRHCNIFRNGEPFKIGTFIIKPFPVQHSNTDGTNCANSGFLIFSTITRQKMLWITDASYVESKFPPVDKICIECNYVDVEDYSDELDTVNGFVEKRRFNSHLSLNRCVQFLKNQDLSKCREIRLLHLTKTQGNIYNIILDKMKEEFHDKKFII